MSGSGKRKKRGFITYEELGKSLGKRGGSFENTEKAFLIIADNKITLVEKKSEYQSHKKRGFKQYRGKVIGQK